MDAKATGGLIARRRKEKNWSQGELTERLHVTDKAVSRWETGRGLPDENPWANVPIHQGRELHTEPPGANGSGRLSCQELILRRNQATMAAKATPNSIPL